MVLVPTVGIRGGLSTDRDTKGEVCTTVDTLVWLYDFIAIFFYVSNLIVSLISVPYFF